MSEVPPPRFSIAVHSYLWIFFALLGFLPGLVIFEEGTIFSEASWFVAAGWPAAMALLCLYANRACSSDTMTFRDGLLWVTRSMLTGWTYLSFATVFAALGAAFCGAVFAAISGDF